MICIKFIKSTILVGECLILFDNLNYNISKRQCYISAHFKLLNLLQIYHLTSSLHSILQIYLPLCFFLLSLLFLYLSPYALAALCLFFLHKFTPFPHILLINKAVIDMFFLFFYFTVSIVRSPEAALLRSIQSSPASNPHSVYQPLSGPCHHFYHLYQCHHHVSGALQPATGASQWVLSVDFSGVRVRDSCRLL